jgi:transposase
MRIIALDVHHSFAQTATLENGTVWDAVKGDLDRGHLLRFTKMSSF